MDIFDFTRGQLDCRSGEQAKEGQSESYYRGYGKEYGGEQVITARTELQEGRSNV